MEQRKRIVIFLTFFTCTASLALLTASLATHKWIVARPYRAINSSLLLDADEQRDSGGEHSTRREPKKFRGEIYFGLFQGTKVLNYGLGDRTAVIWRKCLHNAVNVVCLLNYCRFGQLSSFTIRYRSCSLIIILFKLH